MPAPFLSTSSAGPALALHPLECDFLIGLRDSPGVDDSIRDLADRALAGSLPVSAVGDRLWRDLAVDFGRSFQSGQVEDGETVEIRCDVREFSSQDAVDMFSFWQRVDAVFEGAFRLTGRENAELILRFPPLTRLEEAARSVYGREAANWTYVGGEIDRDEANQLHGARRQPVALSRDPIFFEQAGRKVHGFPFAFHDVYHAIDVAGIHPELLRIGITLYDSIRSLPAELQGLPFIDYQLHGLAELLHVRGMGLGGFLKWAFVPLEETVRRPSQRMIPSRDRHQLLDDCRRYIDHVFESWTASLPEERHPSLLSYRGILLGSIEAARELP